MRWKVFLGVLVLGLATLVYYWTDVCLSQAEKNLVKRNHDAAAAWVQRSSWFGHGLDARTCLIQLKIARRKGDFHEVERKLKQASNLGVSRADLQRERWLAMAQTSQFEGMEAHWNLLLKNARDDEPEIARAHYTWAMLHHNLELAKWTLELWQQDYPLDPEPFILEGRYFQSQQDWENAEKSYQKAFRVAPDNDQAQLLLANALQVRLKTSEAIPLFQKYLRRRPEDLTALRGLAESLATSGDVNGAITLLQKALEKHPDDFMLEKACGELLLSAGKSAESVTLLEKAYRAVPEHANLANSLARALKASGRAAEAEPLFAFVTESQPQLTELANLEKQLQGDQNNLELRMKIAAIVAKYVSRRDAIRWYENLLAISPKHKGAHQELVILYRSLGDETQAEIHATYLERNSG